MLIRASFDEFETYLERAVDRLDQNSPIRTLVREHFAFDDPDAKRGKRLRPRILIAVAETEGANGEDAFAAAAAIELLHNYSLVHDDIEDRDELRHGRPTLWVRHGIPAAITAGDTMCALSHALLLDGADDAPPDRAVAIAATLHRTHYTLCGGQGLDIGFESAPSVAFGEYLAMIAGKTAALFAAACELGALVAGTPRERARAYGQMGSAYGLAFQVRDDILGTWGTPAETGKPAGADIRRRKWSFPVAWAFAGPPSSERDTIARAYASIGTLADDDADAVIAALERLGAHGAADDACDAYIAEAAEIARENGLDGDGRLAKIFSSTARRTA